MWFVWLHNPETGKKPISVHVHLVQSAHGEKGCQYEILWCHLDLYGNRISHAQKPKLPQELS